MFLTSNRDATVAVWVDTTLRAVYIAAPVLTVQSLDPAGGVNITGVPTDNLGDSDGTTEFTRLYLPGTNVTLTAPLIATNGQVFVQWLRDGLPLTTNLTADFTITANTTLRAIYGDPPLLTVQSVNPAVVDITVAPPDNGGGTDGTTEFTRSYYPGTNVTLTALALATNGNFFSEWRQDGLFLTSNLAAVISISGDTTLSAIYVSAPVLTVRSLDPASGVDVTGVSVDNLGQGDGTTEFTRLYVPGTNVTLTVPQIATNGQIFARWLRDG